MAFDQVFQTVELYEHILMQLPGKDIIAMSAVNHHTRNVIKDSHTLQTKLFLVKNPSNSTPVPTRVRVNPMIFNAETDKEYRALGKMPALHMPTIATALAHDDPICHDMFLTQPPVTDMFVEVKWDILYGNAVGICPIFKSKGIKLHHVISEVEDSFHYALPEGVGLKDVRWRAFFVHPNYTVLGKRKWW